MIVQLPIRHQKGGEIMCTCQSEKTWSTMFCGCHSGTAKYEINFVRTGMS